MGGCVGYCDGVGDGVDDGLGDGIVGVEGDGHSCGGIDSGDNGGAVTYGVGGGVVNDFIAVGACGGDGEGGFCVVGGTEGDDEAVVTIGIRNGDGFAYCGSACVGFCNNGGGFDEINGDWFIVTCNCSGGGVTCNCGV